MQTPRILVINPGSTSTKLAVYDGSRLFCESRVEHTEDELAGFADIASQEGYRLRVVEAFIRDNGIDPKGIGAVAARGGLMRPVAGGVYRVDAFMVDDLKDSARRYGREHASNLGCMIAMRLHEKYGMPAFTADPVTVDEMDDVARVSGVPEITRKSHFHALNIKASARRAASELGLGLPAANFVVAHIGGGVSVAAMKGGRVVDVNNALLGMGPFSPQRAGALPVGDLVEMACSGRYEKHELMDKLVKHSGLMGYLGTSDVREVERRIATGDEEAKSVFDAMAYQVAKEIAAMAAVLSGKVDAVVLTGGVSHSVRFTDMVKDRVGFIAPLKVYPGEAEMQALAAYAAAALSGLEEVLEYGRV